MPCFRIHITRPDVQNPAPYIRHAADADAACACVGAYDKKTQTIRNKYNVALKVTSTEEI